MSSSLIGGTIILTFFNDRNSLALIDYYKLTLHTYREPWDRIKFLKIKPLKCKHLKDI